MSEYVKFTCEHAATELSPFGGFAELNAYRRKLVQLRVVAYDFKRNWLRCEGSAIASSESLTHAVVYESDAKAGSIIHCHDSKLWAALLNQAPTSSKAVEYGTPEMAYEVTRLFKHTDVQDRKILVMAGHEGGIVAFGRDLEEAFAVLVREWKGQSR